MKYIAFAPYGGGFMYETLLNLCKERGITITNLCIEITGSPGNLSTWKRGNIKADVICKIADYFHISTDYLLGRTDVLTGENVNNISGNSNNGDNNISIGTKSAEALSEPTDNVTQKFLDVFIHLDLGKQIDVMRYALEQAEKSA